MPKCSRCGGWISALVYECPACGEKPKGPLPRGIIASDVDELAKRDDLTSSPSAPPSASAAPAPGPYAQAPGPTTESPPPITERPVRPTVAPRPPAPRPPAPARAPTPKPAKPEAPVPASEDTEDPEDDVVEVVRKRPAASELPDMDTPVG